MDTVSRRSACASWALGLAILSVCYTTFAPLALIAIFLACFGIFSEMRNRAVLAIAISAVSIFLAIYLWNLRRSNERALRDLVEVRRGL